jgi:hypothetical protein
VIIITSDLDEARAAINALMDAFPNAGVRAINTAMTGIKTDMKKVIRAAYNIPAGVLQKRLHVDRASRQNFRGSIISKGRGIHLTDIPYTRDLRKSRKGVSVNVKKSTGVQRIPKAFIAPGKKSGKLIVLHRKKGAGPGGLVPRTPLEARMAPHPEILYNTPENWRKISALASERIIKAAERELDAELRRQQGKW